MDARRTSTSQLLPHQQRLLISIGAIPSMYSSEVHLAVHVHDAAPWQLLHYLELREADSYEDDRHTSANFCRNQVPHRSWILVKIRTALFDADSPSRFVPKSVRSPQIRSTNDVTTQFSRAVASARCKNVYFMLPVAHLCFLPDVPYLYQSRISHASKKSRCVSRQQKPI